MPATPPHSSTKSAGRMAGTPVSIHPPWRRAVAGIVALSFALTLGLFGLMLCVPAFAP